MDSFLEPHTTSCTRIYCRVFSFWFLSHKRELITVADNRKSIRRSDSLTGASTAVSRKPLSPFFIHLPFKNYPGKADRWLEKLKRQKWKTEDRIKLQIWSICKNEFHLQRDCSIEVKIHFVIEDWDFLKAGSFILTSDTLWNRGTQRLFPVKHLFGEANIA